VATSTHFRTCPLCEATCGLEITMDGDSITDIRGDKDDVFSKGFICPKGTAIKHLQEDPDRLRGPMVRDNGSLREATWDEAWGLLESGLSSVIERHGRDAVAMYAGNPTVHSLSATMMTPVLVRALASKNFYSAATVDQMPKHFTAGFMFGSPTLLPVPDIDRTDYLLMLGANPAVSNGSLATAPDFRGRLDAIRRRGGKVVVVDPRRTETAQAADEHIFIRPGSDAFFLLAIASVVFEENLWTLRDLDGHVAGVDEARDLVRPFTPETVAGVTGVPVETTRRIARELAAAPSACVYERVGAHTQEFGTMTSWASDVVNTITGNLDRPGGRMFPLSVIAGPDPSNEDGGRGRGWSIGRFSSRVKGYPEVYGQLPIATLADEIETPGEGQVRALITVAGNPVLSTPNGRRLSDAFSSLEFMVAVDPYVNETTRHAHVVLPPQPLLARHHFDVAFYFLSVRNVANYSPPSVERDGPDEWEIMSRIALVASGQSVKMDPEIVPQMALMYLVQKATSPGGSLVGKDPAEIIGALQERGPIEKMVDFRLRAGPYGDMFGENPDGLTLAKLEENPHGMDFGPLGSRFPNALETASGKVELAPPEIVRDVPRLVAALGRASNGMLMIGRRQLRSNNSWMHNSASLVRGSNRCTLFINPEDASSLGLAEGAVARITSNVASVEAPVELKEDMMPGVVSLPHGWGHDRDGVRLSVARANAGVSYNDLTDEQKLDPLSGNAVLNAIPVQIEPVS
jgi:anaerobic selenocysteine-containing dehydrogenase